MALWRKPLQFINVMLANQSPMSVAEWGPGRMTYAKKKKPFAEHDLRVTLECAGNNMSRTNTLECILHLTFTYGAFDWPHFFEMQYIVGRQLSLLCMEQEYTG